MMVYLTNNTLPEVSARLVLKNWIELHTNERYKRCLRDCVIPVKDYTDHYRDYNTLDPRSTILCIVPEMDDFETDDLIETEKKLTQAYKDGNRMEVIKLLVTLDGKKFDDERYAKKLEKHDHKEFDRVCKKRNLPCDYHKYQEWVERAQKERREDKEEDLIDATLEAS